MTMATVACEVRGDEAWPVLWNLKQASVLLDDVGQFRPCCGKIGQIEAMWPLLDDLGQCSTMFAHARRCAAMSDPPPPNSTSCPPPHHHHRPHHPVTQPAALQQAVLGAQGGQDNTRQARKWRAQRPANHALRGERSAGPKRASCSCVAVCLQGLPKRQALSTNTPPNILGRRST